MLSNDLINDHPLKPKAILHAERSLWAWTVWVTLWGIYQTWISIPDIVQQTEDMMSIQPQTLEVVTILAYGLFALFLAWYVWKLGAGARWARSSFLWGFILEVIWAVCSPPQGLTDDLGIVPDFGLQAYALYLLYTTPGREWFQPMARHIHRSR